MNEWPLILLIYSRFISNVIKIIETEVRTYNNLHEICFPSFMQRLENLVLVESPSFLLEIFMLIPGYILLSRLRSRSETYVLLFRRRRCRRRCRRRWRRKLFVFRSFSRKL